MSEAAAPTHTAFRYMERFRCIGAECEASCCSVGWYIAVDREHYEVTRCRMAGSEQERQEFDAKFSVVGGAARDDAKHALMVLQSDRRSCTFLGRDRLCGLVQRYGEELLPDTCAVYPRFVTLSGKTHELAGLPSCPEVARQLLLAPDAMELVEVPPTAIARGLIHAHFESHTAEPYTRYHDELRTLALSLLSDPRYPLRTRLSFIAYFANRTLSMLHDDAQQLDEPLLLSETGRILDPGLRAALHEKFESLPADPSFPMCVILGFMSERSDTRMFLELLKQVLAVYGQDPERTIAENGREATLRRLVQAYEKNKLAWSAFAPRIDQYFANYAKHYWAREHYSESANLLVHTVRLLARVVMLRFLLLGHPLLAEAAGSDEAGKAKALDRAVVDVVYRFSRTFDHDLNFRQAIYERLAKANIASLAHALCLASF